LRMQRRRADRRARGRWRDRARRRRGRWRRHPRARPRSGTAPPGAAACAGARVRSPSVERSGRRPVCQPAPARVGNGRCARRRRRLDLQRVVEVEQPQHARHERGAARDRQASAGRAG
jgi:hypothetical protein